MKTQLTTRDVALIPIIFFVFAAFSKNQSDRPLEGGDQDHQKQRGQENVRSKTKELTCTLPYAFSMRPSVITASSEDCQDVTTACQIEDANVVLQGRTVRVQTVYHNKDIVAVRFRLSGWLFSYKTFN